jgi:hypothetical protein
MPLTLELITTDSKARVVPTASDTSVITPAITGATSTVGG